MTAPNPPAGPGSPPDPVRPARSPWVTFAIAASGVYITTLDLSVVNVAFPKIARTFSDATRADIAWVVTAYNILFGALLVAGGRTADRLGRARVFMAGTAAFGVGSALCALAPTLPLLVAGRAVQGLGGAFLMPATLGLLLAAFPPERRTQVVSLWGGIGALGVASGPTLGALLITGWGWRAAFLINVPVCLAAILVGRRVLVETPRAPSAGRPDYFGAVLVTVALAAVALGISQSEEWGWSDPAVVGSLVLAAAIVPVFLRRQARHAEPVLDLTLFRHRSFTVANLGTLFFAVAFSAMALNNVLFLRGAWDYTVLQAGLASAIGPLTVAVVAGPAGRLASRIGFRPLVVAGPLLAATSMAGCATLLDEQPQLGLWLGLSALLGVGIGLTIPILSSAAVSSLPPTRFAVGGAVNNTARQVGAVLGVALLVAVQGTSAAGVTALGGFRRGWALGIAAAAASALVSALQPSHRGDPVPGPAAAPAVAGTPAAAR